jgi:hypothetical protein
MKSKRSANTTVNTAALITVIRNQRSFPITSRLSGNCNACHMRESAGPSVLPPMPEHEPDCASNQSQPTE